MHEICTKPLLNGNFCGLPCFVAAYARIHEFLDVLLSAGEEVVGGFLGIGEGFLTLVVIVVAKIHACLAFAFTVGAGHEDHTFTVFSGRAGNLGYTGNQCYFHNVLGVLDPPCIGGWVKNGGDKYIAKMNNELFLGEIKMISIDILLCVHTVDAIICSGEYLETGRDGTTAVVGGLSFGTWRSEV